MIADNSGAFGSLGSFSAPSISDRGTVAFWGNFRSGVTGIFSGTGGPLSTIADTKGAFSSFDRNIRINNGDTVAFGATLDDGTGGIFTGTSSSITTMANTAGRFRLFGSPSINDGGTVAFKASLDVGGQVGRGIFKSTDGAITTVVDAGGPFFSFKNHDINNNDAIAFSADRDDGSQGVFINSDGATTTTIVDDSGRFLAFPEDGDNSVVSINERGTVTFRALRNDLSTGVFANAGGATVLVSDDSGPFSSFPAIATNNSETVAFLGVPDGAAFARNIAIRRGSVSSSVIGTGDPLFGSTVGNILSFEGGGFNERGQIAFFASLNNGRLVVARATPVPEPSSVALFAAGLVAMGIIRLRYKGKS